MRIKNVIEYQKLLAAKIPVMATGMIMITVGIMKVSITPSANAQKEFLQYFDVASDDPRHNGRMNLYTKMLAKEHMLLP